jgi:hypothetical protein
VSAPVTRRAAALVWGAMLVVPFFFMAMADASRHGAGRPGATALLFWLTVGTSALLIVVSRALPERLGPFRAGRAATAFARLACGDQDLNVSKDAPATAAGIPISLKSPIRSSRWRQEQTWAIWEGPEGTRV